MLERIEKRLTAKGWKVGTAKQFLKLSNDENAYIELRLKLADGLKGKRIGRGMTQIVVPE